MHELNALPCALLAVSDTGEVLAFNSALTRLLCADESSLRHARLGAVLTRPSRVLFDTHIYPLLKFEGYADEIELSLRRGDGTHVQVLMSATRTQQAESAVIRLVFWPVREQRKLEHQLLTAKRVTEQAPGVLFQLVRQRDGTLAMPFASEALRTLYGLAPSAVAESVQPLLDVVAEDDLPAMVARLAESARTLSVWRAEHRASVGGRLRWLEAQGVPQKDEAGRVTWYGYISEVTERRAAEEAVREKETALLANREKTVFLARISHELRTPLNSILGFSQLLMLDPGHSLSSVQAEQVRHIGHAGSDLLQLINELLDVARIEAGSLPLAVEDVPVMPTMRHVQTLLLPLSARRGVQFDIAIGAQLAVQADPQRLRQVLLNLTSNAVKYNRDGGTVRVRAWAEANHVWIEVADEGPGLSAEQRTQLFQPFNRLGAERTSTEGSGLGLVITRALLVAMAGELTVQSELGHGSRFVLRLPKADTCPEPLVPASAPPPRAPDGAAGGAADGGRRVLYVEDHPLNIALMRAIFAERPNYTLEVAETAADAERCVSAVMPDLLLIDMTLPDGRGDTLLRRLRATFGTSLARAIAVSASAQPEEIASAKREGFDAYWTKPLSVAATLTGLDLYLADRTFPGQARADDAPADGARDGGQGVRVTTPDGRDSGQGAPQGTG